MNRLARRFEGYPPGFLEAIDKCCPGRCHATHPVGGRLAGLVAHRRRRRSPARRLTAEPPKFETRPYTRHVPARGGFVQDYFGYLVGVALSS